MEEIIGYISTVGFPIMACVYVYLTNERQRKETSEMIQHITDQHREEMDAMRSTLERNTLALTELTLSIKRGGGPA